MKQVAPYYDLDELIEHLDNIINDYTAIEDIVMLQGISSLDAIIEKERQQAIAKLLKKALSCLDDRDITILWKWAIEKKSQNTISKELGLSQPAIWYRLGKMHERIAETIQLDIEEWLEFLTPPESDLEATSPKPKGYPFELLRKVSDGGRFGITAGYRRWISKHKCKLPEYFEKSFSDNITVCNLCESCKRK